MVVPYSVPDVQYKYYMVVSPLDGRLYITDQQNLRIIRVKTMGAVRAITDNYELVAGTGQQCVPGDPDRCGDGAAATDARLFYPKGRYPRVSRLRNWRKENCHRSRIGVRPTALWLNYAGTVSSS